MPEERAKSFCKALTQYLNEDGIPQVAEQGIIASDSGLDEDWEKFWFGISRLELLTSLMKNLKCPIEK